MGRGEEGGDVEGGETGRRGEGEGNNEASEVDKGGGGLKTDITTVSIIVKPQSPPKL